MSSAVVFQDFFILFILNFMASSILLSNPLRFNRFHNIAVSKIFVSGAFYTRNIVKYSRIDLNIRNSSRISLM